MAEEEWISAGNLIRSLSDCINQAEALLMRKDSGQSPQYGELLSRFQAIFPKVIEGIGSAARLKAEELLMLLDLGLSMCRLGMALVEEDGEHRLVFTLGALNLLYVALSGSVPLSDASLNSTLTFRSLKIIEMAGPQDAANLLGLWQCFLKVLASNNSADDDMRLSLLDLLLRHIVQYSPADQQSVDRAKWLQLLKVALRLSKYALRRKPMRPGSLDPIIDIISTRMLPNDSLLGEILNLPCPRGTDITKLRKPCISNLRGLLMGSSAPPFSPNSLGEALRDALEERDPITLIFSGKVPRKLTTDQCSDLGRIDSWAFMAISRGRFCEKDLMLLFQMLSSLALSLERPLERLIVRALLRRLINQCKVVLPPTVSLLHRLLYYAHASRAQMKNGAREAFDVALRLWRRLPLPQSNANVSFWPLAAMANIVRECPQPGNCAELFRVAQSILDRPGRDGGDDPIRSLAASAALASLHYATPQQMTCMIEMLPRLPLHVAFRLLSMIPFIPSFDNHQLVGKFIPILRASLPEHGHHPLSPAHLEALVSCEVFLKFSSDLSLFEHAELAHLQPLLVSFLQRETIAKSNVALQDIQLAVGRLTGPFSLSLVATMDLPKLTGGAAREDDSVDMELERIISKLKECLECTANRTVVVSQLQTLINSYT